MRENQRVRTPNRANPPPRGCGRRMTAVAAFRSKRRTRHPARFTSSHSSRMEPRPERKGLLFVVGNRPPSHPTEGRDGSPPMLQLGQGRYAGIRSSRRPGRDGKDWRLTGSWQWRQIRRCRVRGDGGCPMSAVSSECTCLRRWVHPGIPKAVHFEHPRDV